MMYDQEPMTDKTKRTGTNYFVQANHGAAVWRRYLQILAEHGWPVDQEEIVIHVIDVKSGDPFPPLAMFGKTQSDYPHLDRDCDCWTDE